MLDPIRLVTDLFKEKNLSNESLHGFAEEFLARLANPGLNPGGIYNQLLIDTTALYQTYFGVIVNQSHHYAIGKGLTIGMNQAHAAVINKLSTLQGLIKYRFKDNRGVYKEFYPQGMKEYHRATIGHSETLFSRFRVFSTMYLSADYPTEVAELNTLITKFNTARRTQETVFGKQAGIRSDRKADRRALTQQLTKCFLIIASNNIEQPAKIHAYYDTRLLPIRKGKKKG